MTGRVLDMVHERDVRESQAVWWLMSWARHGWSCTQEPVVCGTTADGELVLRYVLAPTTQCSLPPGVPYLSTDR